MLSLFVVVAGVIGLNLSDSVSWDPEKRIE
jgi:hypothetical protein